MCSLQNAFFTEPQNALGCVVYGLFVDFVFAGLSRIFGYGSLDKGMCAFLDCLCALQVSFAYRLGLFCL